jgi:hypothetical protein
LKPTPPRESSLLRSVERILRAEGITYRKRWGGPYATAGDPDLYLVSNGRHAEIELKRPGQEPTPLQRLRMREWARAGALTATVHSPEELRMFLAQLLAQPGPTPGPTPVQPPDHS